MKWKLTIPEQFGNQRLLALKYIINNTFSVEGERGKYLNRGIYSLESSTRGSTIY